MPEPQIPDRHSLLDRPEQQLPGVATSPVPVGRPSVACITSSLIQIAALVDEIRHERMSQQSLDPVFWSTKANLIEKECSRVESFKAYKLYDYKTNGRGGNLAYYEWEDHEKIAQLLQREMEALHHQLGIARGQAERLKTGKTPSPVYLFRPRFLELFNNVRKNRNDSAIDTATPDHQDNSPQSNMRQAMINDYCPEKDAGIWDPVLGKWLMQGCVRAAHLFPTRSVKYAHSIFGQGAQEEIFTSKNGLFLSMEIEEALEKGSLVIVPDTDLEPQDPSAPWKDQELRRRRMEEWEANEPKEYKVLVLDSDPVYMTKTVFNREHLGYPVENLVELHGRKLQFLTDFRPRSRYVWWTYLNAITQLSWKPAHKAIQDEVAKATRYWETGGRYVKKNVLVGFIQEIGHDVESIAESLLEHGIEEDSDSTEPDISGIAIVIREVIHRVRENEEYEYDEDEDDDGEDYYAIYKRHITS
ncbi:hypothetical protein CONLIGDRAFT_644179 [Coniochaeta ligniaria NRRL 30616]|uniref:HNH nuclease domain-containing protein n=1 Tax=Coniochaeta ligniaria NRRL 30616 TaxID=1408157 RepID=A0A1J7IS47_9PEZI|nr:hypothetical protein CONLIGDRAFT_644179 [Coniochaeta ligniaria NRRL 30616]